MGVVAVTNRGARLAFAGEKPAAAIAAIKNRNQSLDLFSTEHLLEEL